MITTRRWFLNRSWEEGLVKDFEGGREGGGMETKCFGESSVREALSTFGVSKVDRNFVWAGGGEGGNVGFLEGTRRC